MDLKTPASQEPLPTAWGYERSSLYSGVHRLTLLSWAIALLLLLRLEGNLALQPACILLSLLSSLWAAHCFYKRSTETGHFAVAVGVMAIILASGAAAGAISQLSLAFRMPFVDAHLAKVDRMLGFSSPTVVAYLAAWDHLPSVLGIAYVSSFPLLFGTALCLALQGKDRRAWELSFVFASSIVLSASCAALFPAEGAFRYLGVDTHISAKLPAGSGVYHLAALDHFRDTAVITLDALALQGVVTFPSFHTALALMTTFASRGSGRIFLLMIGWNVVVIVSTIPIGGHYGIDLLGGAIVWGVLTWLAARLAGHERTGTTARRSSSWWRPAPNASSEPTPIC